MEPITVIIERTVLPGSKPAFEALLEGVIAASRDFKGYVDTHVRKPAASDDHRYYVLFRFDTQENLDVWMTSPERLQWVEQIDRLLTKPTQPQVITGLETWFRLPGNKSMPPPPRYKMAAITWAAITPLLIAFNFALEPILSGLSLVPRTLFSTPWIVLIMTYLWMPVMTRLFRFWLYPGLRADHKK